MDEPITPRDLLFIAMGSIVALALLSCGARLASNFCFWMARRIERKEAAAKQ